MWYYYCIYLIFKVYSLFTRGGMKLSNTHKLNGFTIVELLIVVVVIAILAAITVVSYNGISSRTKNAALASDLSSGAKKIMQYQIENSQYPDSTWVSNNLSFGNGATLSYESTATTYCLQGILDSLGMSINETSGNPEQTLCATPANPTFGTAAATQVVVNWVAVPNATGYNVRCSRSPTYAASSGNVSASVTAPTVTRTFTGLNVGTTYYCNVQAVVGASTGSWSGNGSQTTSTPAAPTGLASASITQTGFVINWSAVSGFYQYGARCTTAADTSYASPFLNVTNLTSATTTITGRTANTSYICSVQTRGYNTNSVYSANITITTLP